jgi:putative FmdB family regulatory protein
MPHYDYKCNDCGYKFEVFQKMTEEPLTYCPSCGGKVKRLIGKGAGPIFKGTGFYQTDYKNNKSVKDSDKQSTTKNGAGTKPEAPPAEKSKKEDKQTD